MFSKAGVLFFFIWFSIGTFCYPQLNTDSLQIELEFTQQPDQRIKILGQLIEKKLKSDPNTALDMAYEIKELAEINNLSDAEIQSFNTLSEIYIELSDLKNAMKYAVQAKEYAQSGSNKFGLMKAFYNLGHVYSIMSVYEQSSANFFECLKLSDELNDQLYKSKSYNSIGIVYYQQNNYNKALEYYFKALNIAKEIKYETGISKGLNNVASIYGIRKEYEKCHKFLIEAVQYSLEQKDLNMLGVIYLNLGNYFQDLKQNDSALFYYEKSLDIYRSLNKTVSIISAKIFLAQYYLVIDDVEKGLMYARESHEESSELKLMRNMYETSGLLNQIYTKLGDTMQALHFKVLQLQIKDSLNIEEKQTEISRLESQFEYQKAQQKIKADQQSKDLIILIVLITLLFIIAIIFLLLGRLRIKSKSVLLEKQKLSLDLEIRSKELTSNAIAIMKKNEMLSQIAAKMKAIQKEAVKEETKSALRSIMNELNKAVEEEAWEEFNIRFQQVHNDFFIKLNQKYPTLSPNEQRLCAFLKLNMTTKEISELTGQRTTTIEIARTRLRKKLGITNTQTNLVSFLRQL